MTETMAKEELTVVTFETMEDLVESLNGEVNNSICFMEQLEMEHTDFSFFCDVSLQTHLETLGDSGISFDEVVKCNTNRYGDIIDFYEVGKVDTDDHMFVMAVGQR